MRRPLTQMVRILVVHTRPEALGELVEILSSPRVDVHTARSSVEALHKCSASNYAVIVTDHKPPELDGLQLLDRTRAFCPDAMRILTVPDNPELIAQVDAAPVDSIFRYYAKPVERRQLNRLVAEGLKLHQLEQEQRDLIKKLAIEYQRLQRREKLLDVVVHERTRELEGSYQRLKEANRQALLTLAEAIEAKDAYTKGHCGRVAGFAMALAEATEFPAKDMEALEFASFLHDIGKIGVRDSVLLKPGPLDEEEWLHMRTHPVKGYEIAAQIDLVRPTMSAIRNHHERWDGHGYPDGLKGEAIPMPARIVAIADAYDAMATERPYKTAIPLAECEKLLRKNSGIMFDPYLVEVFIKNHLGALYRDDYDSSPPALSANTIDEEAADTSSAGQRAPR